MLGKPPIQTIEITTNIGCANGCIYCPQSLLNKAYAKRSDQKVMSLADLKSFLNSVSSNVHIHFSGMSEPWQNQECTHMVEYVCRKGHPTSIYSTLSGMEISDIRRLEALPLRRFVVHLSGGRETDGIPVNDRYLTVLDALIDSEIRAEFEYLTKDRHPAIAKRVLSSKVKQLSTRGNSVGILAPPKPFNGRIYCDRLKGHVVLLPSGDVALCCMDYGLKHVLGNLRVNTFGEILGGSEMQRIRKGARNPEIETLCRSCDFGIAQSKVRNRLRNAMRLLSQEVRALFHLSENQLNAH